MLRDSWSSGALALPGEPPLAAGLAEQAGRFAASIEVDLPGPALVRALIAWSQLFGMISFELFGQFAGSADPAEELFEHALGRMAEFVGLPSS